MKYLWHACSVCNDFELREYMKQKKQDYNDNYLSSTLTINELIRLASNMYTLCTHKDSHVQGSKSPEESEIDVLKAEVGQWK